MGLGLCHVPCALTCASRWEGPAMRLGSRPEKTQGQKCQQDSGQPLGAALDMPHCLTANTPRPN